MTHHYIIIYKSAVWGLLHSPMPISKEEVQSHLEIGAYDVVDISVPGSAKSLVVKFNLHDA